MIYKAVSWQIPTFDLATDAAQAASLISSLFETVFYTKTYVEKKKLIIIFFGLGLYILMSTYL